MNTPTEISVKLIVSLESTAAKVIAFPDVKVEFVVAHSRRRREAHVPYDEGRLDGFVDAADEAVYAEAARVFAANLRRFAPDCVS